MAEDLNFDLAPNILPHESVQALTTDRLREIIVRSTRGYLNWTSSNGPKSTRSISLDVPELDQLLDFSDTSHTLVSGGRYFVFQSADGCFHCYDTQSQLRACSHSGDAGAPSEGFTKSMDCVLVDNGTMILAFVDYRKSDERE